MSSPTDLSTLLRFMTQTACIPLAQSLTLARPLHAASQSPESLASITPKEIHTIIGAATDPDSKISKQISNAARRAQKKRAAGNPAPLSSSPKKRKAPSIGTNAATTQCPCLPAPLTDEPTIHAVVVHTNRAPLLLAFTVLLLRYTHPSQPEDSRLSIAMAVVSRGAKLRAVELGIRDGKRVGKAEEMGKGHRCLRVLGRDVAVLRREKDQRTSSHGAAATPITGKKEENREAESDSQATLGAPQTLHEEREKDQDQDQVQEEEEEEEEDWFWGLDIDALADSKSTALLIHTPQSAYTYLAKAFPTVDLENGTKNDKATAKVQAENKAHNLPFVLGAIDALYASWATTLSPDELDRRAWNWYAAVRPAVEHGRQGWGGKGAVHLSAILRLKRATTE